MWRGRTMRGSGRGVGVSSDGDVVEGPGRHVASANSSGTCGEGPRSPARRCEWGNSDVRARMWRHGRARAAVTAGVRRDAWGGVPWRFDNVHYVNLGIIGPDPPLGRPVPDLPVDQGVTSSRRRTERARFPLDRATSRGRMERVSRRGGGYRPEVLGVAGDGHAGGPMARVGSTRLADGRDNSSARPVSPERRPPTTTGSQEPVNAA